MSQCVPPIQNTRKGSEVQPTKRHVIPALTGIRAVAAGMVFFYHWFFSYVETLPRLIRAPFEVGYVGVPIFFALSGFLITIRYYEALKQERIGYGRYLSKRFIRIYPLYFVILTLFVVAFQRPESMVPKDARSFFATYTLTQALFPSLLLIGTTTGWTLTVEGMYYLLAPGLMKWLHKEQRLRALLLRAAVLSLAAAGLGVGMARLPLAEMMPDTLFGAPDTYIMHYTIFGHLADFLVGMVGGILYLRRDELPWLGRYARGLAWLNTFGMYAMVVALDMIDAEAGSPLNRTVAFLVALFSASLILSLSLDNGRRTLLGRGLGSRVMVYLGAISYALYLIQLTEPCQWLYWIFLGETAGVENRIWQAILLYVLATLLAALMYELIERPAHRQLTRWLNKVRVRQTAVSVRG